MPSDQRARFEKAWRDLVEPSFKDHVGIATSGSSGDSVGRLILLSREALLASAAAVNERFASGPQDVWFKSLPSFHVGGLGILMRASLSGASVYEDTSEKWNVPSFALQVAGTTLVSLVPTQVFDIVQAGLRAPSSVRAVIVGGGRFEDSLRLRALELGWPCLPSYGMTETCSQIATALSTEDPRLVVLSHAEARTAADGRLEVRATSLLSAQVDFDPAGATLIDPKKNGWFTAEDRGVVVDGGSRGQILVIEGRTGDFLKIGGEGVILARLEERLESLRLAQNYPHDIALLAAHDDRLGAKLIAITNASVQTNATSKLIEAFNHAVLPFERIREIKHVSEIPRSPLGKLLRGRALSLVGLKPIAN